MVTKIPDLGKKSKRVQIVSAAEIPLSWNYDYNPRRPTTKSKAYKDMLKTIETEPEKFEDYNSGIQVANGKYIMDGGHTYQAILDAKKMGLDVSKVRVHVIFSEGVDVRDMAHRGKFLNNKVTPPFYGERDLLGDWERIKKALPAKYKHLYEFRPGAQPDAPFGVRHLVGLLHAVSHMSPEQSYHNKANLARLYNDDKYKQVLPLLGEFIDLYSQINKDVAKHKAILKLPEADNSREVLMFNGEKVTPEIPEAFLWPLYAAFNVCLDKDKGEWRENPHAKWKQKQDKMVKYLLEKYKEIRDLSRMGKSREVYDRLVVAMST